jgi:GTP-binding protein
MDSKYPGAQTLRLDGGARPMKTSQPAQTPIATQKDIRVPLIALVGRPNVGKSTLFNRFVGRRHALVFDEPGVTRDRIFGEMEVDGRLAQIVDTGGLEVKSDDPMFDHIRAQTELAIEAADFVFVVVDGAAGVTPSDQDVTQRLRRAGKPMALLVNKIDADSRQSMVADFYRLGIKDVLAVSAEHARGIDGVHELLLERLNMPETVVVRPETALDDALESEAEAHERQDSPSFGPDVDEAFVDALGQELSDADLDDQDPDAATVVEEPKAAKSRVEWHGGPIKVAFIGRPNAGKSSLVNRILGEDRHLASEIAGTTRDSVDSHVHLGEQEYVLIDTAGVRRKRSIASKLEQFAVVAAFNSMDRADVSLLILDGTVAPTDQDARIASMAHDKGKGVVIVINKWDLVSNPEWRERYLKAVALQFPFLDYAPIVKLSAKTGRGLNGLFAQIHVVQNERHRRVTTGELNRFFRMVVRSHPPPVRGGKRPQLYFVSQPMVRPPTFVFAANRAHDLHFSYKRYLQNALREHYGFVGTPLWLKFRAHREPRATEPG